MEVDVEPAHEARIATPSATWVSSFADLRSLIAPLAVLGRPLVLVNVNAIRPSCPQWNGDLGVARSVAVTSIAPFLANRIIKVLWTERAVNRDCGMSILTRIFLRVRNNTASSFRALQTEISSAPAAPVRRLIHL